METEGGVSVSIDQVVLTRRCDRFMAVLLSTGYELHPVLLTPA
jgi:hypothetical protein